MEGVADKPKSTDCTLGKQLDTSIECHAVTKVNDALSAAKPRSAVHAHTHQLQSYPNIVICINEDHQARSCTDPWLQKIGTIALNRGTSEAGLGRGRPRAWAGVAAAVGPCPDHGTARSRAWPRDNAGPIAARTPIILLNMKHEMDHIRSIYQVCHARRCTLVWTMHPHGPGLATMCTANALLHHHWGNPNTIHMNGSHKFDVASLSCQQVCLGIYLRLRHNGTNEKVPVPR